MRVYRGQTVKVHRHDLVKIRVLLKSKLGEYTTKDFEAFLLRYRPAMRKKIREIESEIGGELGRRAADEDDVRSKG
jgi:hypothetical protein